MKLTNEQIQQILDCAPEGWTHYCTRNRQYFRRDGNSDMLFVWIVGTESWSVPLDNRTRWLERRERLEEILELRQEVERLREQLSSMAAQHQCGCGYPACNRCRDDADNREMLRATPHQNLNAIKREAFIEGFNAGFTDCWITDEEEHAEVAVEIANQRYPDKDGE